MRARVSLNEPRTEGQAVEISTQQQRESSRCIIRAERQHPVPENFVGERGETRERRAAQRKKIGKRPAGSAGNAVCRRGREDRIGHVFLWVPATKAVGQRSCRDENIYQGCKSDGTRLSQVPHQPGCCEKARESRAKIVDEIKRSDR